MNQTLETNLQILHGEIIYLNNLSIGEIICITQTQNNDLKNTNNFLSFNTRRNRKISLTEFYDLIYEYKNDCLTAGIKYKKTYYKDRGLLPSENFMISLTIFPLTTYEKSFDRN